MANRLNKVAALKSINQTVVSKGARVFGICNEYQTVDGFLAAVGFTTNCAFILEYEGKIADTKTMKDMFLYWIMEDDLSIDDATDFEEVKVITAMNSDGTCSGGDLEYRGLFTQDAIDDMGLKVQNIFNLLSGEIELSEDELMDMMRG